METFLFIFALLMPIIMVIRLKQWLSLPHRCPSCGSRFDEAKVNLFCKIGDKNVYFCKECTDHPIDRLTINNIAFTKKGFSSTELSQLQDFICLYKYDL